MGGYADELDRFILGQVLDPLTGDLIVRLRLERGEWHAVVYTASDYYLQSGNVVLPRETVLLSEFLQRAKSTFSAAYERVSHE